MQIAQPHPRLAIGQRVRVLGMLERPAPAMNPGQFDWAAYYRQQRILASIHISNAGNITHPLAGPARPARVAAPAIAPVARDGFQRRSLARSRVACALLLGDRDPELRDVQEQFRKTGTSHHLASAACTSPCSVDSCCCSAGCCAFGLRLSVVVDARVRRGLRHRGAAVAARRAIDPAVHVFRIRHDLRRRDRSAATARRQRVGDARVRIRWTCTTRAFNSASARCWG